MAARSSSFLCSRSKRLFSPSLLQKKLRFSRATSSVVSSKEEKTALDMIKYAKSLKLDGMPSSALRIHSKPHLDLHILLHEMSLDEIRVPFLPISFFFLSVRRHRLLHLQIVEAGRYAFLCFKN
jgi:hypothetical protein